MTAEGRGHDHPVDPERVAAAQAALPAAAVGEEFARLLAVVADPVRARILVALLAVEELCVGDLALALRINEDAVSYALRVLRDRELVERRTEGRMGFYRLARDPGDQLALAAALQQLSELAERRTWSS